MADRPGVVSKNVNKVEINGVVKLDLTKDTVTAATLLSGYTAHDKSGQLVLGTLESKNVSLGTNVALEDGLLTFDTDLRNYQYGICDCMIIENVNALTYKAFVWRFSQTWYATFSSSQGESVQTDTVAVTTSTETAHFEINLSDSSGNFYAGSVNIYGWSN
nr:MAG TPA: hypothetical protein [Caudoviricetes sp.]